VQAGQSAGSCSLHGFQTEQPQGSLPQRLPELRDRCPKGGLDKEQPVQCADPSLVPCLRSRVANQRGQARVVPAPHDTAACLVPLPSHVQSSQSTSCNQIGSSTTCLEGKRYLASKNGVPTRAAQETSTLSTADRRLGEANEQGAKKSAA
jgi:hypothetical protein